MVHLLFPFYWFLIFYVGTSTRQEVSLKGMAKNNIHQKEKSNLEAMLFL